MFYKQNFKLILIFQGTLKTCIGLIMK